MGCLTVLAGQRKVNETWERATKTAKLYKPKTTETLPDTFDDIIVHNGRGPGYQLARRNAFPRLCQPSHPDTLLEYLRALVSAWRANLSNSFPLT